MRLKTFAMYLVAVLSALVAFQIAWFMHPFLSVPSPYIFYLVVLVIIAWYGGRGLSLLATGIYALLVDNYFLPPRHSLPVGASSDIAALGLFMLVAVVMAYCIDRFRTSHLRTVHYQQQLERLQELSGRLVAETSFDSMLEEVLKATMELLGGEKGMVQLYESRDHVLLLIKQMGFNEEVSATFQRVPIGSFSCGTAFEKKQRVIIENVVTDRDFSALAPLFQELGIVGAQSTPLFGHEGDVFGVLSTFWPKRYSPSRSDLHILDLYAHQAERILLFKRNEELLHVANVALEEQVNEKRSLLQEKDEKLTRLMSELLLTEERERRVLSSELHDSLAQLLTFLQIKLYQTAKAVTGNAKAEGHLREAGKVLHRSLQFTRTLMAEFNPPNFDFIGLPAALLWLKDRMQQHDLQVAMEIECESLLLPHTHVVLLYRSVRELLMNVVKHAKVREATVVLKITSDHMLQITVRDAGRGFARTMKPAANAGDHFGLSSVRERIEEEGGQVHIESEDGKGCTVTITLPLEGVDGVVEMRAAQTQRQDRVTEQRSSDPNQGSLL